jgi:hypothetical protein
LRAGPPYTSPALDQPSPVPRLYTKTLCSTLPAGIDSCVASCAYSGVKSGFVALHQLLKLSMTKYVFWYVSIR